MKKLILAVALTMVAIPAWALEIGEPMPASVSGTKMKNIDGGEVTLADIGKGKKGTLVIFACNHCPFVKAWEDRIAKYGNEYAKKGVGVVLVNSNDPSVNSEDDFPGMQKRAVDKGYKFPYVVDATSQVARDMGAARTPEVFLFDEKGMLSYHGPVDDNSLEAEKVQKPYLKMALDELLAGKAITNKKIAALGCSIKFRKK